MVAIFSRDSEHFVRPARSRVPAAQVQHDRHGGERARFQQPRQLAVPPNDKACDSAYGITARFKKAYSVFAIRRLHRIGSRSFQKGESGGPMHARRRDNHVRLCIASFIASIEASYAAYFAQHLRQRRSYVNIDQTNHRVGIYIVDYIRLLE